MFSFFDAQNFSSAKANAFANRVKGLSPLWGLGQRPKKRS